MAKRGKGKTAKWARRETGKGCDFLISTFLSLFASSPFPPFSRFLNFYFSALRKRDGGCAQGSLYHRRPLDLIIQILPGENQSQGISQTPEIRLEGDPDPGRRSLGDLDLLIQPAPDRV